MLSENNIKPWGGEIVSGSMSQCRAVGFIETRAIVACRVQEGKELHDFQRNLLDIEILSNLRFGSRDASVTRVTNNFQKSAEATHCAHF